MIQSGLYTAPLILTALLSLGLAIYAWQQRDAPGALSVAANTLAVALWAFLYALEIAGADLESKIFWGRLQYLSIPFVPVTLLTFALQYGQRSHLLTRRGLALICIIPTITMILGLTTEQHGLIWSSTTLDHSGPFLALNVSYGSWFWVHFIYSYLLVLLGTLLIMRAFARRAYVYRRQAAVLIVAALIPWLGNFVYVSGVNPIPQLDLTPFGFALTGLLLAWGIFGFRLLDLTPIAHVAVLEGMRDGVIVLDARARINDMNPAAARLLGSSVGQVLGRPAGTLLGARFDPLIMSRDEFTAAEHVTIEQGETRHELELRASPLLNRRSRLIGYLVVLRDVTRERELENLRDDLIHTMVHDLRNPLTSIQVALDMLERMEMADEYGHQLIGVAARGSRRMLNLVNAILELNRLESGQLPLEHASLSLSELIAEVVQSLRPLADAKHVQFCVETAADLPHAWADSRLVSRVLENLIGNAIKFTPEESTINISAWLEADAPDVVQIMVGDSGPGIPDEIRSRLFQKFVTGSAEKKGSGLGLAFCRLAIEAHGGRIWLEQRPGPGATFRFTLPVCPS